MTGVPCCGRCNAWPSSPWGLQLLKASQLPLHFWGKFKVLALTDKAPCSTRPDSLRNLPGVCWDFLEGPEFSGCRV